MTISDMDTLWDQRYDPGTTTSTAYTHTLTGARGCEVTFTAPRDGMVWVTSKCHLANSGNGWTFQALEILEGGTRFAGGSDGWSCARLASDLAETRMDRLVGRLIPGRLYTARQVFRVNAGTGSVGARKLTVGPEPTP